MFVKKIFKNGGDFLWEKLTKKVEPQISVITPFYNTKKEIMMDTVNMVLNQTYPYFEWLIIDDGSAYLALPSSTILGADNR